MPVNRSYDLFFLEHGTKLSMISQVFTQLQPSLTLTHDTQLLISKTVVRGLKEDCQKISPSERMSCIIDNVQERAMSTGISCLPFQYNYVFPILYSKFPQCQDDHDLSFTSLNVRKYYENVSTVEHKLLCVFF